MKNRKIKLLLITLTVMMLVPLPVDAAAIVKGEIPKVEPLQSLPTSIKPNYNHTVQSGEFEAKPVGEDNQSTDQEQTPLPAPVVRSGNDNLIIFLILVIIILAVAGYFGWKKAKRKL